jgi:outer membrane protein assembly factor BamB
VALDVTTGRVKWSHPLPMISFAGATVVNDLVFVATYDGTARALRRSDGSEVWSTQGPAGIVAWPAVAGDTIVWPAGLGREPAVFALRLDAHGAAEPPPQTHVEDRSR